MVLTLFALFVPDLSLLLGTVETQQLLSSSAQTCIRASPAYQLVVGCFGSSDSSVSQSETQRARLVQGVVMTVACFLFLIEIVVQCFGKKG